MTAPTPLFDFTPDTPARSWRIQDDVVMGGRSDGRFTITEEGHGRFYGHVSLENNGGFSSVRHYFAEPSSFADRSHFVLRVKGDGKRYQFRVQPAGERYSYIYEFATSGEWETIEAPFGEMYAAFRGRRLDLPNYAGGAVQEMRLLIGNKKEQDFELLIDKIEVK
jgi:hypothetical protein